MRRGGTCLALSRHVETQRETPGELSLQVESPAFGANGTIPIEHTGDGADVSPPLRWSRLPPETRSIALLVEDPDAPNPEAPRMTFVHWIVVGIPPTLTGFPAGRVPDGAVEGKNDFGVVGWKGPKPPVGRHRYFFKVFALDIALEREGITKPELLSAMKGHILARGELIGTYESPHRH